MRPAQEGPGLGGETDRPIIQKDEPVELEDWLYTSKVGAPCTWGVMMVPPSPC